jgi:4-hydroxy-3-methylbut-2-en-1-yl diphosphate synthase IspG/GcpE
VVEAVCSGHGIAYQLGNLRLTTESQESYVASVTSRVATLMRVGLGDHIHCSLFRKYPKDAPKVEQLAEELGPRYRALVPIVQQNVPKDFELMMAHVCAYHERKFLHLTMKSNSNLMSLIVVRRKAGESFRSEQMLPALVQSGIPIYKDGAQRFQIASFETEGHLVYLISDLRGDKNLQMMLAMAPSVKQVLDKARS